MSSLSRAAAACGCGCSSRCPLQARPSRWAPEWKVSPDGRALCAHVSAEVDRLVLESPIGLEDYSVKVPYATREELTAEALAQPREEIDRFFRGSFAQWRPAFQQYADVQHRWLLGAEAYRIARIAAATYLMAYEQPVVYVLPLVRQPTLLIAGDKDRAAIGRNRVASEVRETLGRYTELAPKAAAALPNGQLVMLQGVGHVAHLEMPGRFNQEVLSFLAQRE